MALITDIFSSKKRTLSFEVFPTGTPEAYTRLLAALGELCELKPDFISCTYGAGGGSRDKTLDVVEHIQKAHRVTAMAHLTCVLHSRAEIQGILEEFEKRGIQNVLALRGDPPKEQPGVSQDPQDFKYSSDLVAFIRNHFRDRISIGVAGFPEKHILAPDADADAYFLKQKMLAGADFVITQLFFDNQVYFDYVARLRKLGVNARVLPGILPVTDYKGLKRFCEKCGAGIPQEIHSLFEPIAEDPARQLEAGVQFAVRQCRELLEGGAPGIHFYTLNKSRVVAQILKSLPGYF